MTKIYLGLKYNKVCFEQEAKVIETYTLNKAEKRKALNTININHVALSIVLIGTVMSKIIQHYSVI